MDMQKVFSKNVINTLTIVIITVMVAAAILGWYMGWFSDLNAMREFVWKAGPLGPGVFVIIQIMQVVLPFIPGGVTLMTGVLVFGPLWGFVLNYVGVCIGSGINFYLARQYGKRLVTQLVDEQTYNKYIGKIENSKGFERFFALSILLPFFPDDTLCLLAGLTNMTPKKFSAIIFLTKPPSIAVYSLVLFSAGNMLSKMIGSML